MRLAIEQRFWPKVEKTDKCWLWTGAKDSTGYGQLMCDVAGRWQPRKAHIISYEFVFGAVPEGTELDHLCRNRGCVNPSHLEPVAHIVNVQRGEKANRTHCPYGHRYSDENTYLYTNKKGSTLRFCKACRKRKRALSDEGIKRLATP